MRAARGEGERLREDILEAARHLLVDTGSATRVTMRAVAELTGVSTPSVYRHFPDKGALLDALAQSALHDLTDLLGAAVSEGRDGWDALSSLCDAYLSFAAARPAEYLLATIVPGRQPEGARVRSMLPIEDPGLLARVGVAVATCRRDGGLDPAFPEVYSRLLVLLLHGVTSVGLSRPDGLDDAAGDVEALLAVLGLTRHPAELMR